jgi:hypothetical protein
MQTSSNIWAVGENGSIIRTINGYDEEVVWTNDKNGLLNATLNDVYAVKNETDVLAVGANGTILKRIGNNNWSLKTTNTTNQFNSINGSGSDNIWAVGNGGVIRHSIDLGET